MVTAGWRWLWCCGGCDDDIDGGAMERVVTRWRGRDGCGVVGWWLRRVPPMRTAASTMPTTAGSEQVLQESPHLKDYKVSKQFKPRDGQNRGQGQVPNKTVAHVKSGNASFTPKKFEKLLRNSQIKNAAADEDVEFAHDFATDKVELDGKTVKEDKEAVKRIKGEALKEKEEPWSINIPYKTSKEKVKTNNNRKSSQPGNTNRTKTHNLVGLRISTYRKGSLLNDPLERIFLETLKESVTKPNRAARFPTFQRTDESDSDDEEEYVIKINKFGAPIYGPRPTPYLNCVNPKDRSSAIQAVTNPFQKN
ncbi:hypothetical protein Tco_0328139 [Tanacetum coccineum]